MPRNALHMDVRFDIYDFLKDKLTPIGKDLCRYKAGYSDETIAEKFKVGKSNVAAIRRSKFGDLRPMKGNGHNNSHHTISVAEWNEIADEFKKMRESIEAWTNHFDERLKKGGL